MGQISVEKSGPPGSDLGGNQQAMLPAAEGMLLNRMGWSAKSTNPKPSFRKVIESITNSVPQSSFFPRRFELHRDALAAFMKKWIFADHSKIESDVSYLNRHYALHCMGEECYYTAHDCHRLFTFIDVYLDFLSYENGVGIHAFIPDEDPFIKQRIDHYVSVILGDKPLSCIREQSIALMKEHSGFTAETDPPEYEKIIAEGDRLRREMLENILMRRKQP